mgnify:CR=1 FL=1
MNQLNQPNQLPQLTPENLEQLRNHFWERRLHTNLCAACEGAGKSKLRCKACGGPADFYVIHMENCGRCIRR